MDKIFPSKSIPASPSPLLFNKKINNSVESYLFKGKELNINQFLRRSKTTGLLVIKGGEIVREEYFQGYSHVDRVTSFSVAKSFVATLIGIAWDEGKIQSLQDSAGKYSVGLKGSAFEQVSIENILQMSSGVDFSEEYDDESTDAFTIYNDMFIFLRPIKKIIKKYPSNNAIGTKFQYASINTQALGMLLEDIYKKSLTEILYEKIWAPIGAQDSAFWLTDMSGNEIAFWGLNATLRDYAKLGLLYLNKGKLNGKQILSEEWIHKSTSPSKEFLQPGRIANDWGYQYHWWVPKNSQGDFAAIGIWGQMIYVNPKENIVIVRTSSDQHFKSHEFESIEVFRALSAKL